MKNPAPLRVDITISNSQDRDTCLTEAVNHLIPSALELRQGILVTQHNSAHYTLEVLASVPCGTIQEKRLKEHNHG